MKIETYTAIVRKTDKKDGEGTGHPDKLQLGRIQVSCAELVGDDTSTIPWWIEPRLDWGWFVVPDIGEVISIDVVTEHDEDGVRNQSIIDAPDPIWAGARYYSSGQSPNNPTAINPAFLTNYGKRRGFATPYGHMVLFDDTKGESQVIITAVVKKHKQGSGEAIDAALTNQIILDKDGIHLSVADNSSKHVALAEYLSDLYTSMKLAYDNHTHATGMGPSGAPGTGGVGLSTLPAWDDKIVSSKVSIPDEQ